MSQVIPPRRAAKTSIATVSLSGTLLDKLEAAARIGFDAVEIFESDLLTCGETPATIRQAVEDLGLEISIYQPFRDFEAMPDPIRTRNLDRAERKFDVMQALGTDLVLVCSNVQAASIDDDARAAADLAEMAERAAKRGLRVGYEALAWGRNVKLWSHAWRIVERAGHPALGLIVDSFHTLALNDSSAGIANLPGDRIFFLQMADAPRLSMDVLSWSRHFRNFPGQGDLPVAGFLRDVLASGYAGPISLEIFNDDVRAAPAPISARDGLRSIAWVMGEAGASELPAPPVFDGVEFIEFAVDGSSSAALASFLQKLGFRHAGSHRSKAVELYRQGRVNLVLNAEPDSAALEHFEMHGASVCAIALRVDDASRAVKRATAMLSPEWREQIGEGERAIPAVRAPDGTLVYLVGPDPSGRSIWEDDFVLFPDPMAEPALVQVDHIAHALPPGRMDNYVLFWRAVFGLQPAQLYELPDPFGLIRSRAMVSADGTLRLPLNISESRETSTGRVITAMSGAGVHHVALDTNDIFATVAALRAQGAPLLTIPANYYDDLAVRFDLSDQRLAELQAANLLYDRDDAGEFLHAYTAGFQDRFYFEVVQRIGGYAGFGAANAPTRMAAQLAERQARGR